MPPRRPLLHHHRQKPLGPAPLASFDRGLSSECNSFDEGLSTLGTGTDPHNPQTGGRRSGHIGVLCQTSIMEEPVSKVRTRTIACQTDRSALRDGIKGKQRKSSQSQTSFDQEPIVVEIANKRSSYHEPTAGPSSPPTTVSPVYQKQESLQPFEVEVDRLPSPSRPSTLDLAKKQKKAPTTFSKVQKLEQKSTAASATSSTSKAAPPVPTTSDVKDEEKKKSSFLGKRDSVASTSGQSEKSRSSPFRSPFSKRRDVSAGDANNASHASSRAVSPMLQIRQRIASLSPGRGRASKKGNVARAKLEALMNRVAHVETGTSDFEASDAEHEYAGGGGLNRQRGMSQRSTRPHQSLSPKPSVAPGRPLALNKLQALIDRSRLGLLHVSDNITNHHHHHDPAHHGHGHSPTESRRRSKSSPPEGEPFLQHRLSIGQVWTHHSPHHHHHHSHGHGHHVVGHGTLSKSSPSNPPSPFEEVITKKFSIQEDKDEKDAEEDDSEDEQPERDVRRHEKRDEQAERAERDPDRPVSPITHSNEQPELFRDDEREKPVEDLEEEKKIGENLLETAEDADEDTSSSVSDILDKVLKQKARDEIAELRKKVQAEREKRQTFRTAPTERPRSQSREVAVVDLNVYVAEAEKQPAPSTGQRIKLNLHLNQDQSIDEVDTGKQHTRTVDPDDWKRFCEQGLHSARRSRLERAQASGSVDDSAWADFNKWSREDKAKSLPIPMIVETAWTPMEHRILNVTPSPSTVWDTANPDSPQHGDDATTGSDGFSSSRNAFDESFNSMSASSPDTTLHHPTDDGEGAAAPPVTVVVPIVIVPPAPSTAETMNTDPPAPPEPAKQTSLPLRKAPAAPTRKAPPPPGPPAAKKADPEPEPVPVIPVPDYSENYNHPQQDGAVQNWDATQYSGEAGAANYSEYDQNAYNAYYYPEYATDATAYPAEYYQQDWQQYQQPDDSGQYYNHQESSYHYDQTVPQAVPHEEMVPSGGTVEAILGSQTDFTGHDVIMSDPSAIDIANEKSDRGEMGNVVSTAHHEQQQPTQTLTAVSAVNAEHVAEHSPLLEEDDEEEGGDAATVILNSRTKFVENSEPNNRNSTSSVDSSFQPLAESVGGGGDAGDDGSGIDYNTQSKHRRLSKVPYTSLDVQDNEAEDEIGEAGQIVPEEETVTPLLAAVVGDVIEEAGNDVTDTDDPQHVQHEPEPEPLPADVVADYDPSLYDPAIYDPAGTGYDINSQEYYDYYYGHLQQQSQEHQPAADTNNANHYYPETTASQPTYEYSTTYQTTSAAAPTDDYSNYHQDAYYGQEWQEQPVVAAASPEWPTYNAYVPPESAASLQPGGGYDQAAYEEASEYEEDAYEEPVYAESGLPKERLFDDDQTAVPFGNLRPEPKKKEGAVPLHLKMAKGLKPSKKKIVNLITKGKYSSGKKKDLFDEIEQNFSGPGGGAPNPTQHSEQWQEYQNMTSRVQGNVDKLKITPLQTPTSPAEERKGPPARPPVHTPSKASHVEELFSLSEANPETEVISSSEVQKKSGPPGRPPPPKAKPGRPPPPKKSDASSVAAAPETPPVQTVPDVSDELADFFGGPMPVQKPDRPAVSSPKQNSKPDPPKSARPVPNVVPPSTKAVTTEIKPVARPKAGGAKGGAAELAMPPAAVSRPASISVAPSAPAPAPVAAKKTSNVDDLLGLFDMPEVPVAAPVPAPAEPAHDDPFATSDPFSTSTEHGSAAGPQHQVNGVGGEGEHAQRETENTSVPLEAPGESNQISKSDDAFEAEWPSTVPEPLTGTENWNGGDSSASTTSAAWEPWGTPDPTEAAAMEIVQEVISSAIAEPIPVESPSLSVPPRVPARPPPPPRPTPPPAVSRGDMFLQQASSDSDVTFAAAFSHTQDESPSDEPLPPPPTAPVATELSESQTSGQSPLAERETKVVSQVESMVVRSQPSPTAVRKSAQIINSTPWGDEPTDSSETGFAVDFESDPFGDSTPAPPASGEDTSDPFGGGTDDGFNMSAAPEEDTSEEATMLKLVASYKNNAPEKININASLLDDSFFDPFATIVPEESPLPAAEVTEQPSETADDDFNVWETPAIRPDILPAGKEKTGRRSSNLSNASRRTSGSVQTPLYDEDDTQPMPEFTWDHPQTSWDLLLRSPPKKTFSGTRYWKQIHVRLTETTLQLYNKPDEQKPFHELPLQGNYMVTEIAIQPLDVFTKIHTTKIEYVFYKERVGIRPGQITKASKGQITKLGLPLEHASQTTELLKFGSLNCRVLRDFVHAVEDVLFRIPMIRDRQMIYKQEEVQAHVIDEFTAKVDKQGIISDRKGRVRVYCLCFVSGMPEVEFGLNDIARKGKEVVGRHDILPIYTEEWIRMENVELHHCVSKDEYAKTKVIKFVPPDACFFELARFRVRPPKNRELPLAIKITFTMEGYRVGVKVEAQTTAYYNRKRAQPCDDIQIRVPIPESWIYLFRTEKLFGYGSKHATSKKTGLIKGMTEKLRTAGVSQSTDPSQIAVTSGAARYEHVYRSLVWRISRLPKEGQGAFANHMMTCRLDLNNYDTMPERFEPNAEIEFTMPAATASHTTLRSISATCDDPPEKWVKYLSKYEYVVEIDYKIDRGDVQLYGAGATD